jgi:hypothetical protein
VSITVAFFLTVVTLLEIRNGDCVARVKVTSADVAEDPCEATTWHVVALVAVKSVPIIRQFGVVVANTTLELLPLEAASLTTEPDG